MKNILIFLLLSISGVSSQDLSDNLLLHYEFNGNAIDSSDNDYHGTISGVIFGLDRNGNPNSAAYFDGIDDFIDLPNLTELKPDLPVSFSFWIKYDNPNYQDTAVFNTSFDNDRSSGVYFNSQISSGNYAINYGDGSFSYNPTTRRTLTSNEPIDNENWHHVVAIVRSTTDMSIFIDCVDFGGAYSGSGGNLVYSSSPGSIGRRDRDLNVPANYFKGKLDDFKYWDRELTISEVNDLCSKLSVSDFNSKSKSAIIYPNPSNGIINIKSNNDFDSMIIHNSLGQQMAEVSFKTRINLSFLPNGIYFMSLIKDDFVVRRRVVLNSFH